MNLYVYELCMNLNIHAPKASEIPLMTMAHSSLSAECHYSAWTFAETLQAASLKMHAVWNDVVKKCQTEALIPSYAKKFKISQWIKLKNFEITLHLFSA